MKLKKHMNNIIPIKIQSFTDIITNSSSETFVVDSNKTKHKLQQILDELYNPEEDRFSGECCGVEIQTWDEYIKECIEEYKDIPDLYEEEIYAEFPTKEEDYEAFVYEHIKWWNADLETCRRMLLVRVDYGYKNAREYVNKMLNIIDSDHY